MPVAADPRENHLLAVLPPAEWKRWQPQLERVELPLGHVVYESGSTMSHIYFPVTAIVSPLYVMENGSSARSRSWATKASSVSRSSWAENPRQAARWCKVPGLLPLTATPIKEEFNRAPVLHLLLRYTQALITQMAQTAVCNRHHSLDQQLCRWLLLSLDRLQGNELVMTRS
jgi:hypothetical protein